MQAFQNAHIRYLSRIADQYWGAGRLLWIVGIAHPALYCINHSVELFLRALWLQENEFDDEDAMKSALIKYQRGPKAAHDIQQMIDKLSEESKKGLTSFSLVNSNILRFGDKHGFAYGDTLIKEVESFVRVVRSKLGLTNPNNQFGWIANAIGSRINNYRTEKGIKLILSSLNKFTKKDLIKAIKRSFRK